ncbi:hypothetical protein LguiA_011152 [Lonicera macranthoides]
MAGGGKKRSTKYKGRRPTDSSSSTRSALFVQGGLLSDWSPVDSTPSRGRSSNSKNGNLRSASSSGNSARTRPSGLGIESQKPRRNAFDYVYPTVDAQEGSLPHGGNDGDNNVEESEPIILVDSKDAHVVTYVDQTPNMEPQTVKCTYDYSTSLRLDDNTHRGLGFCDETEASETIIGSCSKLENKEGSFDSSFSEEEMETDESFVHQVNNKMDDELLAATSSPKKNSGFLSIGGMKLYTLDISDEEGDEDDGEEGPDDESLESSDSEDSSASSDSDGSSYSDSDVDEEVANDYIEGIGGTHKVVNVDRLVGQNLDVSDDDDDGITGGSFNETLERFGGIALQDASREYGMRKPQSGRKYVAKSSKFRAATYASSPDLDNIILGKDQRPISGKKKNVARFPQSWPSVAQKSKNFKKFPGEKKKHRKEKIALKRRERMIRRGVDLEQINSILEQIVLDGVEIFSFQLMHSQDCSQVQRLAAIYRLRSGCEGTGKRR